MTSPEQLELDDHTGHEGQQKTGGDESDDRRPGGVLGDAKRTQKGTQVADVAMATYPSFVEGQFMVFSNLCLIRQPGQLRGRGRLRRQQ